MKTLPEFREYVYSFLDVEDLDIAESLLNAWAKEGFYRIVKVARRNPFFEAAYTTTVDETSNEVAYPTGLETIEWVRVDGRVVEEIGFREGYDQWSDDNGFTMQGRPVAYSDNNGTLVFWPAPTEQLDVEIVGWREPSVTWAGIEGVPDMPEQFESTLASYMLYRAYGHQGLIEDQSVERAEFESQLRQFQQWEQEPGAHAPRVLGGGRRRFGLGPAPLTFPIRMG